MSFYSNQEVKVLRKGSSSMRGSREKTAPKMDMAPLIDCVFLLLIFFMVSTTFAPMPGIRVKLPPPGRPTTEKPKGMIMRIVNPQGSEVFGTMILDENIVDLPALLAELQRAPEDKKTMLIIQSERNVYHEQIVMVMDLAKRAGVDRIGFAMVAREGP